MTVSDWDTQCTAPWFHADSESSTSECHPCTPSYQALSSLPSTTSHFPTLITLLLALHSESTAHSTSPSALSPSRSPKTVYSTASPDHALPPSESSPSTVHPTSNALSASTTKPLPQFSDRDKSFPVPSGRIATAGIRFHLYFSIMFSTQPTDPFH